MKTLFKIGKIAGINLVIFGFIHFLLLDKIFPGNIVMKEWAGIITIGLTVITLGCAFAILIKFLIDKIRDL